jgi:ATP-dependent DNA ligase
MPGSCQRLDSNRPTLIFTAMSVTRELQRRLPPDRSLRPFEPCLPRPAKQPPSGPGWIHEIKHDGFRILAHSDGRSVRLLTLRQKTDGITLNIHYEGDGAAIYKAACTLGCEGIVSERLGSPYRAGRSVHWVKVKNPAAPAVRREAQEEWGQKRKSQ